MTDARVSLDPDDWDEVRRLGHRMLDDMLEFQRYISQRPVWTRPSDRARQFYTESLPREGTSLAAIYEEFQHHILPFGLGNAHPRFWGWVNGTGTPGGMLATLLEGGMNNHSTFGDQSGVALERQVLRWCVELLGVPEGSTGVLVSSGSMAQITGLIVARDNMVPEVVERGVAALPSQAVVYASAEVHNSVDKALAMIGLGRQALRRIPVDVNYRVILPALEAAILEDRARGKTPLCIVGCAATVNTGATDDLQGLAAIAARQQLWFHVDAAFGAALAASERHRSTIAGIDRADSIAFDFHKWFSVPYDSACVLIRAGRRHRESFSPPAAYLGALPGGLSFSGGSFGELGPDLSRGFRALRVWMTLKEQGIHRIGALVDQNVDDAQHLAAVVEAHPDLELLAPAPLNVVVFRYRPRDLGDAVLNDLNQRILVALHERACAIPSSTVLNGRFGLRVANVNQRTQRSHLDDLVRDVITLGRELQPGRAHGGNANRIVEAVRRQSHR